MKTFFLFSAALILNLPAFGQSEKNETLIQRPDSEKVINAISADLKLSSKQEEKIKKAVNEQTRDFDKIMSDYKKNYEEMKSLEYKVNDLKYKMVKINKDLPDLIREFLDDEQKLKFEEILNPKPKAEGKKEEVKQQEQKNPESVSSDKTQQPKKKKRVLVKRKKKPAAAPAPAVKQDSGKETTEKTPSKEKPDEESAYYP